MGDFKSAFDRTMQYEGGYSNDPNDRGGETYRGVARRIHPSWEGWLTVDNLKFMGLHLNDNPKLQFQVEVFYRKEYWNRFNGDSFPDALSQEMFDCAVNCGLGTAVKFLQRAISQFVVGIVDDGGFGPKTFQATHEALEEGHLDSLVESLKNQRRERYQKIAANDPSQQKFLKGWLRRVDEGVA